MSLDEDKFIASVKIRAAANAGTFSATPCFRAILEAGVGEISGGRLHPFGFAAKAKWADANEQRA